MRQMKTEPLGGGGVSSEQQVKRGDPGWKNSETAFEDNLIVCVENPMESTEKLLESITQSGHVSDLSQNPLCAYILQTNHWKSKFKKALTMA